MANPSNKHHTTLNLDFDGGRSMTGAVLVFKWNVALRPEEARRARAIIERTSRYQTFSHFIRHGVVRLVEEEERRLKKEEAANVNEE